MTIADHLRDIDRARVARLGLAVDDGDLDRSNQVLLEANAENAVHLLILAMTQHLLVAMTAPQLTVEQVRAVFQRTILDYQQQAGGDPQQAEDE